MSYINFYESPLGKITLASDGKSLTGLWFEGQKHFGSTLDELREEKSLTVFDETRLWLDIYFGGKEPKFMPELNLKGTDFRIRVWKALLEIPYGKTVTYGDISKAMGKAAYQAVGSAVGHNPISIIVPCHRVLGKSGSLTGYAGGLERKAALLEKERTPQSVCCYSKAAGVIFP